MTNHAPFSHWNLLSSLDPFYLLLFRNLLSSNCTGRLVRSLMFLATFIILCRLLLHICFVLKALLCYLEQHLCSRRDSPMSSRMHLHPSINTSPLMQPLPTCAPSLWLLSEAHSHSLPLALNADLSREDFDPTFIAALLSGGNREGLVEVVLDTGCTFAISPDRSDFLTYHETKQGDRLQVQTAGGPTSIAGHGSVQWTLVNEDGNPLPLELFCYHVPSAKIRLLSPQDFCQSQGFDRTTDQFGGNSSYFWMYATRQQQRFQCPVDPRSNLPIALARTLRRSGESLQSQVSTPGNSCSTCSVNHPNHSMTVFDDNNHNLTSAQKDLLLWHLRLAHIGFQHLQYLMRERSPDYTIAVSPKDRSKDSISKDQRCYRLTCIQVKDKSTYSCAPPLCTACEIGKSKRRSTKSISKRITHQMIMKRDHLLPGDAVSIDQYESAVRGRLPSGNRREPFGVQYVGGTIFCDHASGYIACFHQASLRADDTIRSKRAFERDAKLYGIRIRSYHADNGIFKAKDFVQELISLEQTMQLSAVGAHHQNGIAERAIRTVTEKARTMLHHALLHWPEETQVDLWPHALDYATWLYNHTPSISNGWAPIELYCGTSFICSHLQRAKVWGCPGYVLSPTLQDGRKIPKWAPRARRGQFLGFSHNHSSLVGLMRNLKTQHVSAQFHVVYDEYFTTVASADEDNETWIDLFTFHRESYGPDSHEEHSPIRLADTANVNEFEPEVHEHSPLYHPISPNHSRTSTSQTSSPIADAETTSEYSSRDERDGSPDHSPSTPHTSTPLRDSYDEDTEIHDDQDIATPISEHKPSRLRRPNPRIYGEEMGKYHLSHSLLTHLCWSCTSISFA